MFDRPVLSHPEVLVAQTDTVPLFLTLQIFQASRVQYYSATARFGLLVI